MKTYSRSFFGAIFALVLLSAVAMATPVMLNIINQPLNVAGGGGSFTANVNGGPSFLAYCVDFENTLNVPDRYSVNVSTLSNLANTRYGTTPASSFSFGGSTLSAMDRYLLSGWLTTQYDGAGGTKDDGIQKAIWSLLDVTGTSFNSGTEATWFANALNWKATASATTIADLVARIFILTSTDVAGQLLDCRYFFGEQELIGLKDPPTTSAVPEPTTLGLVGASLIGIAMLRKRKHQRPTS